MPFIFNTYIYVFALIISHFFTVVYFVSTKSWWMNACCNRKEKKKKYKMKNKTRNINAVPKKLKLKSIYWENTNRKEQKLWAPILSDSKPKCDIYFLTRTEFSDLVFSSCLSVEMCSSGVVWSGYQSIIRFSVKTKIWKNGNSAHFSFFCLKPKTEKRFLLSASKNKKMKKQKSNNDLNLVFRFFVFWFSFINRLVQD